MCTCKYTVRSLDLLAVSFVWLFLGMIVEEVIPHILVIVFLEMYTFYRVIWQYTPDSLVLRNLTVNENSDGEEQCKQAVICWIKNAWHVLFG